MSISDVELEAQFSRGRPVTRVAAESPSVPARWRTVAVGSTPGERVAAALALWQTGVAEVMPGFWAVLQESLTDVWVGERAGEPVLVYAVEYVDRAGLDADDPGVRVPAVWVGAPPTPELQPAEPELWSAAPAAVIDFYRGVHGAFTAPDERSFGLPAVAGLGTLAAALEYDADEGDWEGAPPADRLFVITETYSGVRLCISPDLPTATGVAVYRYDEPDEPKPFAELLDHNLMVRFEVE